ncbi:hypothetical protein MKX08_001788 [Trichoderma sp. CBMAI-0020]|nr:hypothetical protein MKX08_001788 [Trichoderma sp. CBMAI-0020]
MTKGGLPLIHGNADQDPGEGISAPGGKEGEISGVQCQLAMMIPSVVGGFAETLRRSWPLAEAGPFWRPSVETLFHRLC